MTINKTEVRRATFNTFSTIVQKHSSYIIKNQIKTIYWCTDILNTQVYFYTDSFNNDAEANCFALEKNTGFVMQRPPLSKAA